MLTTQLPSYWLCFVPAYTETTGVLDVIAVAPDELIDHVGPDSVQLLTVADEYRRAHPDQRIVFAAELTRWIADDEMTWHDMCVDFDAVLDELTTNGHGLAIEVSELVLHAVADSGRNSIVMRGPNWTEPMSIHVPPSKALLLRTLEGDWSGRYTQIGPRFRRSQ